MKKFWGAVVSREHVLTGIEGGFAQACHGKKAPLTRMKKDDWLVFYSPKVAMGGKEACQKFTGIGKIVDGKAYEFDMGGGFVPFRTDVHFIKFAKETSILPLIEDLNFIKNKKSWGSVFRFGHFSIPEDDFRKISRAMGVNIDSEIQAPSSPTTQVEEDFEDSKQKTTSKVKRKKMEKEIMLKEFIAQHSESSKKITPEKIWNLWSDINNWPKWDAGIEACEFDGDFVNGASFVLTPKGGGTPVAAQLQEVVEGKKFSDLARLPFGTVEFLHEIEKSPLHGCKVTHKIIARIANEQASFFESKIWPSMELGLPESVVNLVKLAESI